MFKSERIRDPIHNLIEFRADEFEHTMWKIIQTGPYQRLRRIKQLGFSEFVCPGATHSRFSHSIGVFHIARRLMQIIQRHLTSADSYLESRAHQAIAAALVHDIGHGPFSHAFEEVGRRLNLKMAKHETVSDILIREGEVADALNVLGSGFASDTADIIKSGNPTNIYSAVVSSQFDADRLDYMQRDRLMTGTQIGAIDFEWLIANLIVDKVDYGVDDKPLGSVETFVLGPKAIFAAETYVLGLFQLYPTLYFHKTTRGLEKVFTELLIKIFSLIKNGSFKRTGLPKKHPLVKFARNPDQIDHLLSLDDSVINGALPMLLDAKDACVSDLSKRLRDRKIYKSINIRGEVIHQLGSKESEIEEKVDKICAHIGNKIKDWLSENTSDIPRILIDKAERVPYKQFQESKGPLNQIRIKTETGELVDLGERSEAVRAIQPFRLYRAYLTNEDDESRKIVENFIKEGVKNGSKS